MQTAQKSNVTLLQRTQFLIDSTVDAKRNGLFQVGDGYTQVESLSNHINPLPRFCFLETDSRNEGGQKGNAAFVVKCRTGENPRIIRILLIQPFPTQSRAPSNLFGSFVMNGPGSLRMYLT